MPASGKTDLGIGEAEVSHLPRRLIETKHLAAARCAASYCHDPIRCKEPREGKHQVCDACGISNLCRPHVGERVCSDSAEGVVQVLLSFGLHHVDHLQPTGCCAYGVRHAHRVVEWIQPREEERSKLCGLDFNGSIPSPISLRCYFAKGFVTLTLRTHSLLLRHIVWPRVTE